MKIIKLFLSSLLLTVFFDVGPKPSIEVKVNGVKEEVFVTLLSERESYGPYRYTESYADANPIIDERTFNKINTCDDYYYLNEGRYIKETETFSWTYYPPNPFKILVYVPSKDKVYVSEKITRSAFNARYSVTIDNEVITVKDETDITYLIAPFFIRVIVTILIELLIGYLFFKYRKKKEVTIIAIVNLVTQVLLNAFILLSTHIGGLLATMILYIPAEIVVFVIEAIIYYIFLRSKEGEEKRHPVLYAFVANLLTFLVGLVLPGIIF